MTDADFWLDLQGTTKWRNDSIIFAHAWIICVIGMGKYSKGCCLLLFLNSAPAALFLCCTSAVIGFKYFTYHN